MNNIIEKAKEYATKAHDDCNHKYDGYPYSTHLELTYNYGLKYSHLLPK